MMDSVYTLQNRGNGKARSAIPRFVVNITWFCCILIAFDFKGQQSGGWYQITSFLLTAVLLGMVGLLLSRQKAYYSNKRLQLVLNFLMLFLGSTVFVAYWQYVPLSNYQVMIAPYLLLFLAYWMASGLCRHFGADAAMRMFFPALKVLVAFSMIWTLYYGAQGSDVTLETVRYRVISAVLPLGIAYLISAAVSQSLTRWDKVFAALALLILIVGQTRSNILIVVVALIFATYGHSPNKVTWLRKMKRVVLWGAAWIVGAIILADIFQSFISTSTDAGFLEMWSSRIFGSTRQHGFDLTTASRLAEYDNQMKRLFSSPINALLGLGLGAPYTYSGVHADLFASVLGEDAIPVDYWNGGHSLWVYTLYANGLLIGGAFLVFIAYTVWTSIRLLKLTGKMAVRGDRHKIVTLATGYLCILTTSFTAFPLGSRPVTFLLGILIALLIGIEHALSRLNKLRNHEILR